MPSRPEPRITLGSSSSNRTLAGPRVRTVGVLVRSLSEDDDATAMGLACPRPVGTTCLRTGRGLLLLGTFVGTAIINLLGLVVTTREGPRVTIKPTPVGAVQV